MDFSFLKDAFELTPPKKRSHGCSKKCSHGCSKKCSHGCSKKCSHGCSKKCNLQENFTVGKLGDIDQYLLDKSNLVTTGIDGGASGYDPDPEAEKRRLEAKYGGISIALAETQQRMNSTVEQKQDTSDADLAKIREQTVNFKKWTANLEAEIASLEGQQKRAEARAAQVEKDIDDYSKIDGTSDQQLNKLKTFFGQSKSKLNNANNLLKTKITELVQAANRLRPVTIEYTSTQKDTDAAVRDTEATRAAVTAARNDFSHKNQQVVNLNSDLAKINGDFDIIEAQISEKQNALRSGVGAGYFDFTSLLKTLDNKHSIEQQFLKTENEEGRIDKLYNKHTRLLNNSNLIKLPSDMLKVNQHREIQKNTHSMQNLKNDLASSSKNIQIKENYNQKKLFYIFLLKHVFVSLIVVLIVAVLSRTGYISNKLSSILIGLIFTVLGGLIGVNYFINRNRNDIYFKKKDFPIPEPVLAPAKNPKCDI